MELIIFVSLSPTWCNYQEVQCLTMALAELLRDIIGLNLVVPQRATCVAFGIMATSSGRRGSHWMR
jgi:hypothetical protein